MRYMRPPRPTFGGESRRQQLRGGDEQLPGGRGHRQEVLPRTEAEAAGAEGRGVKPGHRADVGDEMVVAAAVAAVLRVLSSVSSSSFLLLFLV